MHRFINQINVSITTNRTCTLRCDHCYIAPHLFADQTQMTTETFRKIFDQVENLVQKDSRLEEVEWEAIGGETTMMPFEWWEENLPWALDRIDKINRMIDSEVKDPGSLNFLTNLIYKDDRYTDLINQYGKHPCFSLYTSWEPDTRRFGKNNKLFPRFLEMLERVHADNKILDIILTDEIVKIGPKFLIDTFVSRGITDFSIKMLSPYGSGKEFFKHNMTDFKAMSDFLRELGRIKPDYVSYTPEDEMMSSLYRGSSFQCNGNFQYDLAIEPEGTCTFNANQTADEAVLSSRTIHVDDPLWAEKVMFENKEEENNKLSLEHPSCNQCEYMRYCNAGWYHYKVHDPEVIRLYDQQDCTGYKNLWDERKEMLTGSLLDVSKQIHKRTRERIKEGVMIPQEGFINTDEASALKESDLPEDYQEFFDLLSQFDRSKAIIINEEILHNKKIMERIWFYESMSIRTIIKDEKLLDSTIVDHWMYRNIQFLNIEKNLIEEWLNNNSQSRISKHTKEASSKLSGNSEGRGSDFVIDDRNEELFRTIIETKIGLKEEVKKEDFKDDDYLSELIGRIDMEQKLRSIRLDEPRKAS